MTPDTNNERSDLLGELGFFLEERAGVWVVVDDCGGVAPASLNERVLWKALHEVIAAQAPAAEPDGVIREVAWAHLRLMMEHSAFARKLELDDALANIAEFAKTSTTPPAPTEQWRDIETAPQDGTRVILAEAEKVFHGGFVGVQFKEHRDADGNYLDQTDADAYWMNFEEGDVCHPTHWQPEPALPAPPQGAAKGG